MDTKRNSDGKLYKHTDSVAYTNRHSLFDQYAHTYRNSLGYADLNPVAYTHADAYTQP